MKMYVLFLILFAAACSQIPKKQLVPVKISETDIYECREYQKSVLDRAYSEVKGAKDAGLVFTKDTKLARELLGNFDTDRGLYKPKSILVQNVLNQCNPDTIKEFDEKYKQLGKCSLMFSELNYFQSLAVALKKYPWPVDLKLEGKKVALDYVRYFSEGDYPLLNRLIALSVLDELSVNQVVNKDLHKEIKVLMTESRAYVESLRLKLNKDPGLNCESLSIIRDELAYSNNVANKIKELLTRI